MDKDEKLIEEILELLSRMTDEERKDVIDYALILHKEHNP